MKVKILKVKDGIIEPLGDDMPACYMCGCSADMCHYPDHVCACAVNPCPNPGSLCPCGR